MKKKKFEDQFFKWCLVLEFLFDKNSLTRPFHIKNPKNLAPFPNDVAKTLIFSLVSQRTLICLLLGNQTKIKTLEIKGVFHRSKFV